MVVWHDVLDILYGIQGEVNLYSGMLNKMLHDERKKMSRDRLISA